MKQKNVGYKNHFSIRIVTTCWLRVGGLHHAICKLWQFFQNYPLIPKIPNHWGLHWGFQSTDKSLTLSYRIYDTLVDFELGLDWKTPSMVLKIYDNWWSSDYNKSISKTDIRFGIYFAFENVWNCYFWRHWLRGPSTVRWKHR